MRHEKKEAQRTQKSQKGVVSPNLTSSVPSVFSVVPFSVVHSARAARRNGNQIKCLDRIRRASRHLSEVVDQWDPSVSGGWEAIGDGGPIALLEHSPLRGDCQAPLPRAAQSRSPTSFATGDV
jgi:hypothetical protein